MLKEGRVFRPSAAFQQNAQIGSAGEYQKLCRQAKRNPEKFWGRLARKELTWVKPWTKTLVWKTPFAQWFVGGRINASVNCLDRHLLGPRRNKAALIWEGEPGDRRTLTYQELHYEVCRMANALRRLGLVAGDRVGIYMPMVPEAAVAMLACARLGLTHSVVFGGFSAQALRDRMNDAQAKAVITADGGFRRGGIIALKQNVDDALKESPGVRHVIVYKRTGQDIAMMPGRDHWWHDLVAGEPGVCEPAKLESEHPLFILYTSGTTGKPKGIVHSTAGYLLGAALTARWVFDLKEDDAFWCTADIGWVTGHSYVVYGPLANGATSVMYEGAPNYPEWDRLWSIIERMRVSIFYTAPTAIRAFMRAGEDWPGKHDLSSLRLLGSVGEPINPEAWMWYHRVIGGGRCPIVDTWWQTETGAIMISPLPGATPTKPGSATLPLPGIDADVVTRDGVSVGAHAGGFLVIQRPWPSMLRGIYGDPERYKKQYWSQIRIPDPKSKVQGLKSKNPGVGQAVYFTGDGARRDQDGYFWVMGRVDDVINVAGHRLGTMEIESALVSHPSVAEAAVVGRPDDFKGTAIAAFVTLKSGQEKSDALRSELIQHVAREIGSIAKPDDIRFTDALPKTRSGKIMRRLLRDVASGSHVMGDTTTLEDLSVLAKLREEDE
ncbi:MAG TPA: acetate--CoA ligase [Elusimicrobiota bacterium]|nr:acetate--CoA ligase [Elusimicrobiota bacterium]